MSKAALSKLWSFFALTLLTLSFLFFLRTTGADPKGDSFGILGYKATTIPILALPMDLFLMCVTLWLTWVWSTKIGGATWAHRLPIFHFESKDVDPGTRGGKFYQGCAVGLALVFPLLLIVQMATRFHDGTVYVTKGPDARIVAQGWGHFDMGTLSKAAGEGMLRFGERDGPQYFTWEPWFFSIWLLLVGAFWVATVWSIFRAGSQAGPVAS